MKTNAIGIDDQLLELTTFTIPIKIENNKEISIVFADKLFVRVLSVKKIGRVLFGQGGCRPNRRFKWPIKNIKFKTTLWPIVFQMFTPNTLHAYYQNRIPLFLKLKKKNQTAINRITLIRNPPTNLGLRSQMLQTSLRASTFIVSPKKLATRRLTATQHGLFDDCLTFSGKRKITSRHSRQLRSLL